MAGIWLTKSGNLGIVPDRQYYELQLDAYDTSNNSITFSIVSGSLPTGIQLNTNGLIYGVPVNNATENVITNEFTIRITTSTGSVTDRTFSISVAKIISNAASNTSPVISSNVPSFSTTAGTIANVRNGDNFFFQFDATDPNNDPITYTFVSGTLPTGLNFNNGNGWINGSVLSSSINYYDYDFTLQVEKTANVLANSGPVDFTIRLLGIVDDTLTWTNPSDLGEIYAGDISELEIVASVASGQTLSYRLDQSSIGAIPPGLELQDSGLIVGRPSFNGFSIDRNTTTFDDNETTLDFIYNFTVIAYDPLGIDYGSRTFSLRIFKRTMDPYQNLYIQLLPNSEQREIYNNIVNNVELIPQDYLYRPSDLWFGRNTLRRSLFLSGLQTKDIATYIDSMSLNHYWKTLYFGNIKTAIAQNSDLETKYEVVYLEILDPGVNSDGLGPNLSLQWPENSANVSTVYPNSFPNMVYRVTNQVGYEDKGVLPDWMTSRQSDGRVLGFTRALVLCYTQPGQSAAVAFRLQNEINNFKLIDFTIDRYDWDNILSEYYITNPLTGSGTIIANTTSNIVLGTGTDFQNELDVGKTIFVNNISIGNIANIVSSTNLTLSANSSIVVNASAFTYSTNTFIRNNFINGTGTISANINSNIVLGFDGNISGTGTISGNSGSVTIIGYGTDFGNQLSVGKNLYVSGNSVGTVKRILSNSNLQLNNTLSNTISNVSYTTEGLRTIFERQLRLGDTILVSNTIIGTVDRIVSNSNLILQSNSSSNVTDQSFQHFAQDTVSIPGQGDNYLKFPQVTILA